MRQVPVARTLALTFHTDCRGANMANEISDRWLATSPWSD